MARKRHFVKRFFKAVGPGFVTGAADDDPSGIATYSQTGALFGYAQLWLVPFTYLFMTAVQEMCGRIGLVTGTGLAGVLRRHYPRYVLWSAVTLLLIANVINIGADLGAMVAAVQLVLPVPFMPLLIGIAVFILALQIYVPYRSYARFLSYLTFSLLAYVGVALVVRQDWTGIFYALSVPHIELSRAYVLNIAAFMGTTISPYLLFWQADEEVEEEIVRHEIREIGAGTPHLRAGDIAGMRLDTLLGMLASQVVAFFIIVSVASTLGGEGGHPIQSAADAAAALRPVAGDFAFLLFALGIVGTGLLAVPVLAGSVSYAIAEAFGWKEGLGEKPSQAPAFYGTIALVILAGLAVNFSPFDAITLLYWAAIFNGLLAPPLIALLLLVGNNKKILGAHTNGHLSNTLGVLITLFMAAVAATLVYMSVA